MDFNSEAYATVGGQNSNNSISIKNNFLDKLKNNQSWDLINRTDKKVAESIPAKDLWDQIAFAAWSAADPGLHFNTTINDWHTCKSSGDITASNPCSEYLFLNDTACNLASVNLLKLKKDNHLGLDIDNFLHVIKLLTLTLEISVSMAQFPSKKLAQNSYDFRTLGIGYANLGAYLMSIGVPYDSDEGRNIAAAIASILTGHAYRVSADIAKEKGSFKKYDYNKNHMLRVISNHKLAAMGNKTGYKKLEINPIPLNKEYIVFNDLLETAQNVWTEALEKGNKYGFRNAQVSAIAPTGTIGLLMGCATTGIEPDFSLVKYKSLAGGGNVKIINDAVPNALKTLGYTPKEVTEITNYVVGTYSLKGNPVINHESLIKKGFTLDVIEKIEESLKSVFHINFAFTSEVMGLDFCENILKISKEELLNNSSILHILGYTNKEIEEANKYILGSLNIENAPKIKKEHLPVFDCANFNGEDGKRILSYESHIKMLAAVQSFISGAISKTINMPSSASIKDCSDAYLMAWELGVKAVSLYRDGSKLSQPLNSAMRSAKAINEDYIDNLFNSNFSNKNQQVKNIAANFANNVSTRRYPDSKRKGYIQKVNINGTKMYLHTGEYSDGTLAEIFLDVYKEGVALRSMMNSFAIAISIGLQYGVPLSEYVDSFTFTRFEPSGIVQGHKNIKMTTSTIDYVFRDLAINYLDRYDLANYIDNNETLKNKKEYVQEPIENKEKKVTVNDPTLTATSKNKGFEGEVCPKCKNLTMIRTGTCLLCTTCGETTGCS